MGYSLRIVSQSSSGEVPASSRIKSEGEMEYKIKKQICAASCVDYGLSLNDNFVTFVIMVKLVWLTVVYGYNLAIGRVFQSVYFLSFRYLHVPCYQVSTTYEQAT